MAQVPGTRPDAGDIARDLRAPPQPTVPPSDARIENRGSAAVDAPASAQLRFEVRSVRVDGTSSLPADEAQALVADCVGTQIGLDRLNACAGRITARLRERGNLVARAYLPAQTVEDGVVRIAVLDGRYGALQLRNDSNVADDRLDALAGRALCGGPLRTCRDGPIVAEPLERALLRLGDLPGIAAEGELAPGTDIGTADLGIAVRRTAQGQGFAVLDNHGNAATGRARLRAGLDVFEPFGVGDRLSLAGLSSGRGLAQLQAGYDRALGDRGMRVGLSLGALHYRLRGDFAATDGRGSAEELSSTVSLPIVRGRVTNVAVLGTASWRWLRDQNLPQPGTTARRSLRTASVALDASTSATPASVQSGSIGLTVGALDLDDALAAIDQRTLRTDGSYQRMNVALSQRVEVLPRQAWSVSLAGQLASKNLDSAEKMPLGGPFAVRAAQVGAGAGDQAVLASTEWRIRTLDAAQGLSVAAFFDWGRARRSKAPVQLLSNTVLLGGPGASVRLVGDRGWQLDASLARLTVGGQAGEDTPRSWRSWLSLSVPFVRP